MEAVARAKQWSDAKLQYCWAPNGGDNHKAGNFVCEQICKRKSVKEWDPYRSDCSGLVSWAWKLPAPGRTTHTLAPFDTQVSVAIPAAELRPGDAINSQNHVMLFKEWITPGKKAAFIEEPGCGAGMGYAREVTSNVTLSGNDITLSGRGSFVAIRNPKLRVGAATPAPDQPTNGDPKPTDPKPDGGEPKPTDPKPNGETPDPVSETTRGSLDDVSCDGVRGWAIGPNNKAVDVELSFFAGRGEQGAASSRTAANVHRQELPPAQADYGFDVDVPLLAQDGKPHPVFAYALGPNGEMKLLGESKSFTCAPRAFTISTADGVRRPVTQLDAWSRTALDVSKHAPEKVAEYVSGPEFPAKPLAVRAPDGKVYVVDGMLRRRIDSMALSRWKLMAADRSADEIAKLKDGPAWPDAPFFFRGDDTQVYALDAKVPESAGSESPVTPSSDDPSTEEQGGSPAETERDEEEAKDAPMSTKKRPKSADAGCSAYGGPAGTNGVGVVLLSLLPLAALGRRRRSRV
jgi:hypothetical protein